MTTMLRTFAILLSAVLLASCKKAAGPEILDETSSVPIAEVAADVLLDCAREEHVTLLQAHRAGLWPDHAENSIAAINASLDAGAVFLEIDVARTADGALVLMHDATLERTTTGSGDIADATLDELLTLQLVNEAGEATGASIPLFEDALEVMMGRGFAQIDRKSSVSFDEIAEVIESRGEADQVIIITYSLDEAIAVHGRMPDVLISLGIGSLEELQAAESAGIPRDRMVAWLGVGNGNPPLDEALAKLEIESSFGDFEAERDGRADYLQMARHGAEIISVDRVKAASDALGSIGTLEKLVEICDLSSTP